MAEAMVKGGLEMHWSGSSRTSSGFPDPKCYYLSFVYAQPDDRISHGCAYSNPPDFAFRRSQYVFDIRSTTRASDWSRKRFPFPWVICSVLCLSCFYLGTSVCFYEFWNRAGNILLAEDLRLIEVVGLFYWLACWRFAIHVVWQVMFRLSGVWVLKGFCCFYFQVCVWIWDDVSSSFQYVNVLCPVLWLHIAAGMCCSLV